MLVGGIDISGKSGITNYTFMGIVIGNIEKINSMHKQLLDTQNNFNNFIDKKRRNAIITKLQIDGKESMALCIKIDRDAIIERIKNMRRIKRSGISNKKIFRAYNILLFRHIRNIIERFLIEHNYDLTELNFQCDGDCVNFVKDNSLRNINRGNAYELADLVAWANNKGLEPNGIIPVDMTDPLEMELKGALL